MPSLGSHMARARTIADRLRLPEIDADRGAYYLGSTAPDIRVITRMDRRVTHFFELDDLGDQDSVSRMFAEHPGLAAPVGLDAATTAFIAGYLTHLVLDEAFIGQVYRPNFGAQSPRDDDPKANVLDRALQYELDRRDREDRAAMEEIREALSRTTAPRAIPFIADEHLLEWTAVSEDIATHPPDFGRFRRMMTRHLEQAGYGLDEINNYCDEPAVLVAEAFGIVDEERIERFWHDAEERMTDRVRSYLR
ncbi:MAG: hypothetical protein WCI61_07175 [Chloroflexota bacterium]